MQVSTGSWRIDGGFGFDGAGGRFGWDFVKFGFGGFCLQVAW
jgi:hypothetical protein